MVKFDKFTLDNGLKVIVHKDTSTTITSVNILYNVGARDEDPERTGFAHLFEHFMFEGSVNIPSYDKALQLAGGENNAYTTNDITNYYITLPKENLETAFWLESDRMLGLDFSDEKLAIQKNVVIEEFNQRYLNQPYGDVFLLLRPLAYNVHPYQWATIGKDITHIQNANLQDVRDFFNRHYAPNNAILSVAGNVDVIEIKFLAEKWFGSIPRQNIIKRDLPKEPKQEKAKSLTVERDVPYDSIYKAFHMSSRIDQDYYTYDLISDLLANGKSCRLYQSLVKDKKLFSEINAYITGSIDEGLFLVSGKLIHGVSMKDAEEAIDLELENISNQDISEDEMEKVKNKFESVYQFGQISVLNKASDLAFYELLGDANKINTEIENYRNVSIDDVKDISKKTFKRSNSSTLYYLSKK